MKILKSRRCKTFGDRFSSVFIRLPLETFKNDVKPAWYAIPRSCAEERQTFVLSKSRRHKTTRRLDRIHLLTRSSQPDRASTLSSMTDYSAFAPARPPQSPTDPSAPSDPGSSQLAPQFQNLQIDSAYARNNSPGQYQPQYASYPREQRPGPPPQLPHLNIPSAQAHSHASPRSAPSPLGGNSGTGYGYSSANRPRPNLGGGIGPASPAPSSSAGDSPTRVPRKSSLANNGSGVSPSPSHERLPTIPSSSSSMHFSTAFGPNEGQHDVDSNQRDSSGGEAVFNGAALTSGAIPAVSREFASPPPLAPAPTAKATKKANPLEDLIATETLYVEDLGAVIKVRLLLVPMRLAG